MHDAGGPYRAECERTVDFLSRRLDLPEGLAHLTFQSVFGPAARIGPENRSQHERPQPLSGETDARDGMVTRTVQIL